MERIEEAGQTVKELIDKYQVTAVAIGNGTASRETRAFFKSVVPDNITVSVISEAGASVYSASEAGREEFPDQDVTVRGAVSIGRRLMDPLAELVKIDPKAIEGAVQPASCVFATPVCGRRNCVLISPRPAMSCR
jgi:uncharacterized protein